MYFKKKPTFPIRLTFFVLDVFTKGGFHSRQRAHSGLSVALSSSPLAPRAEPPALTFSRFLFLFYSAVLFGFRHSALIKMFSCRNSLNSSSGLPAQQQTSDRGIQCLESAARNLVKEPRREGEFTHSGGFRTCLINYSSKGLKSFLPSKAVEELI